MRGNILLLIMLFCPLATFAQAERPTKNAEESVEETKVISERAALRKERNTLEISTALNGSLNTLNDAWIETSGGDNSVTTATSLSLTHKYVNGNFSLSSTLSAKFGYYYVAVERTDDDGATYEEGVWYKNQDEISFSIAPAFSMSKNWSYGVTLGFRSQFANGYVSSSSQESIHLKSGFMSPGYVNLSLGVNYQSPLEKFPIKISMSPLAFNGIFVINEEIRTNAVYQYKEHIEDNWKYTDPYGVRYNDSSKLEGGSAVQVDFTRSFGKNSTFKYTTSAYTFYGWITNAASSNGYKDYKEYEEAVDAWDDTSDVDKPTFLVKPTVRWTNKLEIKATDYLSTNINMELYYDRAQNVNIQMKTILSLGVSYKFKNK